MKINLTKNNLIIKIFNYFVLPLVAPTASSEEGGEGAVVWSHSFMNIVGMLGPK